MYDRFTDNARNLMSQARREAEARSHNYIGVEHMILALSKMDTCTALKILGKLNVQPKQLETDVEKLIEAPTHDCITFGQLQFTPRVIQVLGCAIDEAHGLNHDHLGTEHILLGFLRKREGISDIVLNNLKIEYEDVHALVIEMTGAIVKETEKPEEKTQKPAKVKCKYCKQTFDPEVISLHEDAHTLRKIGPGAYVIHVPDSKRQNTKETVQVFADALKCLSAANPGKNILSTPITSVSVFSLSFVIEWAVVVL